jgi:ribulose-phosphate 3-epimerase
MSAIVPAVLPKTREELEDKLARLDGLVDAIQLDIVDGRFASPPSWPYTEPDHASLPGDEALPLLGHFNFELDLMVADPRHVAGAWIENGITRLTIHAESATDLPALLEELTVGYGHAKGFAPNLLSIGLAIGAATPISLIEPYLDRADYVQFMGIAVVGSQGQPFDARALQKVKTFRRKYPDIPVQVDGAVSLATAPALLDAGVTRLVIGSALWKAPDLKEELGKFRALAEEYGIYER